MRCAARTLALTALVLLAPPAGMARAEVSRTDGAWQLENDAMRVTVDESTAQLAVALKSTGTVWRQEPQSEQARADDVKVLRVPEPPTIDGSNSEWSGEAPVWTPWVGEDGERNLSGGAYIRWDEQNLYLYVRVRDNQVAFGDEDPREWWEADSVEFWVGDVQVGLHLNPAVPLAVDSSGRPYEGSQVAVRLIPGGPLPGFGVEAAIPLRHFPALHDPETGLRFYFAIGQNDADPGPGEPVHRVAQGYYPATWVHSQPNTFAVAVLADAEGNAPPLSRENDRTNVLFGSGVTGVTGDSAAGRVTYALLVTRGQAEPLPLQVTLSLVGQEPALDMAIACADGPGTPMRRVSYPRALYPDDPQRYFLAMADYCDGHYVWAGDEVYRNRWLSVGGSLDMPWVAATDGVQGMMAIALTPEDCVLQMQPHAFGDVQLGFPGFLWEPIKGTWGADRRLRLQFFDTGGHVTACKIYRQLAQETGDFRTLADKAAVNPDVRKLMGAVDWWGANGLPFVKEAVAAGMTHGLVNGRWTPEDMRQMAAMGWLVGEYDNYVDIKDAPEVRPHRAPVDKFAVVKADGELMTAWVERDADMNPTGHYMKQCTAKQLGVARLLMPDLLDRYPYNARFLDVTSAESLIQCYSPDHPTDRRSDRANRQALQRYFAGELGLVMGGEHGRWWSAPILDYHEGMMGGGHYSWPAGYLRDVKDRSELSENYLKYGISPANRAPLFELVFHDCVVDYWYWGATNDYLNSVAPEITARKTAMNVLYGTPPMMWANSHGLRWTVPEEREQMVAIYRDTCKLHEVIGMQEMLSHEFLTDDRMVQRTTWADGTVCTVNFGKEPYRVPDADVACELGENDYLVDGATIREVHGRVSVTGRDEDFVRMTGIRVPRTGYTFVDSGDSGYREGPVVVRGQVTIDPASKEETHITLSPGSVFAADLSPWEPDWTDPEARVLLALDEQGKPAERLKWEKPDELVLVAPTDERGRYLVLTGSKALVPDLGIAALGVEPAAPADPEAEVEIAASLSNAGLAAAEDVALELRLGSDRGPLLARFDNLTVGAGAETRATHRIQAGLLDGPRRIVAVMADDGQVSLTGSREAAADFVGPVDAARFSFRRELAMSVPGGDAAGIAVEMPMELPAGTDPVNLRVDFGRGAVAPAEFEPAAPGGREGTLVFCLPAGLPGGAQANGLLLGAPEGSDRVMPHAGDVYVAEDGSLVQARTYSARFEDGVLGSISVRGPDGVEVPVASRIIVSSAETGWGSEDGELTSFRVIERGPVRSVVTCTKVLAGSYNLRRRWEFYADRFVVESEVDPPLSTLTRAQYVTPGKATNATGRSALMDGSGEGEEFGFQGRPQWYAVFADSYRNACIALTPPGGFTWWDQGILGQASLDNGGSGPERRVYIWGPGASDDSFARATAQAYAEGVTLGN